MRVLQRPLHGVAGRALRGLNRNVADAPSRRADTRPEDPALLRFSAMTDDITALAEKLGALIAEDERFRRLREVENRVLARPELKALMEEYEQVRLTMAHKERNFQPIEPSEKRGYADVARRVQEQADLRELAKAQADYAALMEGVNRAIRSRIDAGFDGAESADDEATS
jgi:cell fate (sporulation/competence/biofilm development) regulator YlbF (YheA/YmcA/DUF963 family)